MAVVCWFVAVSYASAVPFTLTTTLTGDFRADNPDNLFVNVTVTGDTTSNTVNWLVDINSPLHPSAVLGAFAFNVLADSSLVSFSNFSPSAWSVSSPGNNIEGSGGADFLFQSLDPSGSSNNVTNSVNLTFTARLSSGTWDPSMFLNAPLSDGGGITDPGSQLGAHLRSLSTAGCTGCSDSGFASGGWASVPEPSTLLLCGIGAFGAVFSRRRRS
jgi:hypothetical protein